MLIDIHIKFHEDILNRFQVTERTRFCDGQSSKGNNSKSINATNRMVLEVLKIKCPTTSPVLGTSV